MQAKPIRTKPTRRAVLAMLGSFAASPLLRASTDPDSTDPEWTTPMPPYRIAGNLHYVGSRELASFLVATPRGHILINGNLASSPPQIADSLEKLGFRYRDVKILLISHAHFDHCSGSAQIKRETGAQYWVMDSDVPVVESGGKEDFHFAADPAMRFPPAPVDRALADGDQVKLGGSFLTARKTAGHTKGCTTWTLTLEDRGRRLDAVIVGSPYVLESYNLIDDPNYPRMAADFARQFQTLQALPCDIFLGAHGSYYRMLQKYDRMRHGNGNDAANPFIDPSGYREFVAGREQAFHRELARQKAARRSAHPG